MDIIAVPASSLRGIALKLRVAMYDTTETRDPILTVRALKQVLPVLERVKTDDGWGDVVRDEIADFRRQLDGVYRQVVELDRRTAGKRRERRIG